MSIIRMRINKVLQSNDGPPPKVFARITRIDDRGRSVPSSQRYELVPISTQDGDSATIHLSSGAYAVEVRLPTGELLADSLQIEEGEVQLLVLTAENSPHEWLSWQHLAGNAPSRSRSLHSREAPREAGEVEGRGASGSAPQAHQPRHRARGKSDGPSVTRALISVTESLRLERDLLERIGLSEAGGLVRAAENVAEPKIWAPDEPAKISNPGRPIHLLTLEAMSNERQFLGRNPWQALPALRGSSENILTGLKVGARGRVVNPSVGDDLGAVFPIPYELRKRGFANRGFAAVRRRMGVELICLPTPWVEIWSGGEAVVEVGVQIPRYEHEFASSVVVRDQQLAVLLGFLSTGALSAVNRLSEASSEMLFEKNANPFAAAAGGYALVGSAVDASPRKWHRWIENLMGRFEDLPDGAIQYGTMRLRMRKSVDDVQAASRAFKVAYRRGLPFYSMGVRWLLDGLERTAAEDQEAQEMATAVRRLASRLHPQSPFTILRLGKR
ncbi:hypothetical protein [Silanimonas sp.]|uniref:hypothetical protein n=1 Tax=Silanimonas sp. TaxID=1929290 RepID=UPI0022C65352|nr:hypothetical protein [Silanimonas sp.]MCZ8115973.1 hypothetical protein [Silanimonas sp.]